MKKSLGDVSYIGKTVDTNGFGIGVVIDTEFCNGDTMLTLKYHKCRYAKSICAIINLKPNDMKKKKDLNDCGNFHGWIHDTFDWIDPDVKKYMFRAWCARGVSYRKINLNK